jgi:hypothetical protein
MYPSTYQNKEIVNKSKGGYDRILALSLASHLPLRKLREQSGDE